MWIKSSYKTRNIYTFGNDLSKQSDSLLVCFRSFMLQLFSLYDWAMNFTFSYAASCFQNIQVRYSTVVLRSVVWTSLRSRLRTLCLVPSQAVGLARRIYSCDMRHVRSRRRGPRAISCVRVEKWKKWGWEVVFFLRCAPDFSC